jgi:hypothetical protein
LFNKIAFSKQHFTKDPSTIVPVDYSFHPMHFKKVQIRKHRFRKILKTKTRNTTENIENHQATDKTKGRWKGPTTA